MLADFNREEGDASHIKGNYGIMWFEKVEKDEVGGDFSLSFSSSSSASAALD